MRLLIVGGSDAGSIIPDTPGIELVHPMHTGSDSVGVHEKVASGRIRKVVILDGEATSAGFSPFTATADAYDHKEYYPGAEALHLRVTGDDATGRLLGAQIAGHSKVEVAERIDIFAAALFHAMTVEEINGLDLSYTPPLGSPWDAVQVAAQAWTAMQRSNRIGG